MQIEMPDAAGRGGKMYSKIGTPDNFEVPECPRVEGANLGWPRVYLALCASILAGL